MINQYMEVASHLLSRCYRMVIGRSSQLRKKTTLQAYLSAPLSSQFLRAGNLKICCAKKTRVIGVIWCCLKNFHDTLKPFKPLKWSIQYAFEGKSTERYLVLSHPVQPCFIVILPSHWWMDSLHFLLILHEPVRPCNWLLQRRFPSKNNSLAASDSVFLPTTGKRLTPLLGCDGKWAR